MTSPNEPGHSGPGDSPNGAGNSAATPRKRPPARPAPQRQPTRTAPGAEARLNRFISGTAAPGAAKTPPPEAEPAPAPTQNESRETDAYASELPDLSGPIPRGGQRKSVIDRSGRPDDRAGPAGTPHPGVVAHARPAAGQHADPPGRPVEHPEGVAGAVGRVVLRLDDRRRVPVSGARRHGRVEQAEQQRRRPTEQHQRQRGVGVRPARSSAAPC